MSMKLRTAALTVLSLALAATVGHADGIGGGGPIVWRPGGPLFGNDCEPSCNGVLCPGTNYCNTNCQCVPEGGGGGPGGCLANPTSAQAASANFIDPSLLPPVTFNVFNEGPDPNPLTAGNRLMCVSAQAFQVPVKHSIHWGGLYQRIQMAQQSVQFEIQLTGLDAGQPNMLDFDFVSLSASIPSFSSVALNNAMTGNNLLTLCHHLTPISQGWIDLTTGVATAKLQVDLSNSVLHFSPPAIVGGRVAGDFHPGANPTLTIRFSGYESFAQASATHP